MEKAVSYIEGSTAYFKDNFGLEGLDSFNIGGLPVPHIFIPYDPRDCY
jgi:hypothetical protein